MKENVEAMNNIEDEAIHGFCAKVLALVSELQEKEEAMGQKLVPTLWEMTLVDLGLTMYNRMADDRAKVIFVDKEPEVEDLIVLLVDGRPVGAWPNSSEGRKTCARKSQEFDDRAITVVTMDLQEVDYE